MCRCPLPWPKLVLAWGRVIEWGSVLHVLTGRLNQIVRDMHQTRRARRVSRARCESQCDHPARHHLQPRFDHLRSLALPSTVPYRIGRLPAQRAER